MEAKEADPQLEGFNRLVALPKHVKTAYVMLKVLPDGRICGVHRLLFHWTMHVDIDETGYADRYCYATRELAEQAMVKWNGKGDPENWHKHPGTGRYRNIVTGKEWLEGEIEPA